MIVDLMPPRVDSFGRGAHAADGISLMARLTANNTLISRAIQPPICIASLQIRQWGHRLLQNMSPMPQCDPAIKWNWHRWLPKVLSRTDPLQQLPVNNLHFWRWRGLLKSFYGNSQMNGWMTRDSLSYTIIPFLSSLSLSLSCYQDNQDSSVHWSKEGSVQKLSPR